MRELWPYVLMDSVLFAVSFLLLYRANKLPHRASSHMQLFAMVLFLCLCVFAFYDADYFHYRDVLLNASWESSHIEKVYYPIFEICRDQYYLFRLIIWGGAITCLVLSLRNLPLDKNFALLCFVGLCVSKFAYGRVSLAMTLSMLGIAIAFSEHKKALPYFIIGGLVVYTSSFFHSSMVFGIAMILLSVLTMNMGKKTLVLGIIGLIILIQFFQIYAGGFIEQMIDSDDTQALSTAQYYIYSDFTGNQGLSMIVQTLLERIPLYLLLFELTVIRWKGEYKKWPSSIKVISNFSFWTIIAATIFLVETSVNTYTFYYRFIHFAYLPTALTVAFLIKNKIRESLSKTILYIGVVGSFYSMFLYTIHAYTGGLTF